MSSPPLTPLRQYIPSIETSPTQRHSLSRRSSSVTGANNSINTGNRSPRSSYSNHRLSNASRYSGGIGDLTGQLDSSVGRNSTTGAGNLADELEFADEDDEWDYDGVDEGVSGLSLAGDGDDAEGENSHGKNSGIDVTHDGTTTTTTTTTSPHHPKHDPSSPSPVQQRTPARNFSRPMSRDSQLGSPSESFSFELDDAMAAISRLADPAAQQHADAIPHAIEALQHLTAQTSLEMHTQRLTTSTNSLSSHLASQTRVIASLSSSLISPFGLTAPLDPRFIDDLLPDLLQVLQSQPAPDSQALAGLAKLDRETADLLQTLSSLTDSLQMGRQATTSAARHLRSTHALVTQLRRDAETADQARWKIEKEGWDRRLAERWCARECTDVVGGFEQVCEGLRRGLEESSAAA